MQILLMRHGDALVKKTCDKERPLSNLGRKESKLMASWLCNQFPKIDQVLISPYLRARQTLECLQHTLMLPDQPEVLMELMPSGKAKLVCRYLHALANAGVNQVLIISHLPVVGDLVANLCHNEQPWMFATAAVAGIYLDATSGHGKLCWQVDPQLLAKY